MNAQFTRDCFGPAFAWQRTQFSDDVYDEPPEGMSRDSITQRRDGKYMMAPELYQGPGGKFLRRGVDDVTTDERDHPYYEELDRMGQLDAARFHTNTREGDEFPYGLVNDIYGDLYDKGINHHDLSLMPLRKVLRIHLHHYPPQPRPQPPPIPRVPPPLPRS